MTLHPDEPLPDDIEMLKAMLLTQQAALVAAEARATEAESEARTRALLIEKLKHIIAKLRHERFGQSAERGSLLDQLELRLFELQEDAAQAETAPPAAEEKVMVQPFPRRKPARRPLPEHLPRERVVHPGPSACLCCGGMLRKSRLVTKPLR